MKGLDLSGFFTTKAEAVDFSARLSDVSAELYEVETELEQSLQQKLGIRRKEKFMSLLRENQVPLDSNNTINAFIEQINQTISTMPEATITLAIEPNRDILKSISDWFQLNLEHQVLLDIQIDEKLVAGATVNYQGKTYNASVQPVFEKMDPKSQNLQQTQKQKSKTDTGKQNVSNEMHQNNANKHTSQRSHPESKNKVNNDKQEFRII